jgi:hypothetical protein
VYGGRRFALISPNWITAIFVATDCVSIVAQSIGAAMLFNDALSLDELKRARRILEAGLFVQVLAFSVFLFIAVWFDLKTTRHLGPRIAHLRWFMNAFYISGALIMIRSIYRLAGTSVRLSSRDPFPLISIAAEFITINFDARPPSGYLWSASACPPLRVRSLTNPLLLTGHEWPYYVLDAVPIAVSVVIFNIVYPPDYLPKDRKETVGAPHEPLPKSSEELPEYGQEQMKPLAENRDMQAV